MTTSRKWGQLTATKTLNALTDSGMKQLGTAYFTPNSIRIVFDGDDGFFNGIDERLPSALKPLPIRM